MSGSSLNRIKLLIKCYVDGNSTHPQMRRHRDPVLELHRLARAEKHRLAAMEYGGKLPPAWVGYVIQWWVWPLLSLRNSIMEFFYPTKELNRKARHLLPDVFRMWWLAMRHNLSPFHFYMYRLHENGWSSGNEPMLLTAWEFNAIGRRMARLRGTDVGWLDNKDRFFEFCSENRIQTIPLIDLNDPRAVDRLESKDLFVKPVFGHSGTGCKILRYVSGEGTWRLGEASLGRSVLKSALDKEYGNQPYIVSYRYRNHETIKWMSNRVLTTLRILTAWNAEGGIDLFRATLRVPNTAEAIVDNSSQGGLSIPVDPATGQIDGIAKCWKENFMTDKLPGAEHSIIGYQLPLWKELQDTVRRAHAAAGNYNFLGWDVAIAEEGVVISECNVWSDIELVQVPQWRPFLDDDVLPYFLLEKCLWQEEE